MEVGLYTTFHFVDDATYSDSDSGTLWKFNASYDLHDQLMAYGTISEGYRRGGSNAVPLSGVFAEDPAWQRYDSDTVTNYEIGIKGTGEQAFFNVDFFYVDWKDIRSTPPLPTGHSLRHRMGGRPYRGPGSRV
jgi:outer membrane receptor protein involved in Fe transport